MAELPKDSARTVVTAELTPAVEEFLERYARRARRVVAPTPDGDQPVDLRVRHRVCADPRLATLRRVLDELDPKSALVFVRDGDSARPFAPCSGTWLRRHDSGRSHVGLVAAPGTDLVVLFDLPASREELREAAAGAEAHGRARSAASARESARA